MTNYSVHTDEQLLELLKQSEEGAFTEIYHRYWEQLYRSSYRKLSDKEQAREIVHDVLVDIWKRREQLSISHLPAYLEKAIRFKVINYINREKTPAFFNQFDDILHSPFLADSQINISEFTRLLNAYIQTLPEKQQRIFTMYYFQNLSAKEIAAEMNLSTKTVQNNISLTLQYLRSHFKYLVTSLIIAAGSC